MRPYRKSAALLSLATALGSAEVVADAVSLPPLPLGNTSFLDGVVRPGMLFELPIQHYRSPRPPGITTVMPASTSAATCGWSVRITPLPGS